MVEGDQYMFGLILLIAVIVVIGIVLFRILPQISDKDGYDHGPDRWKHIPPH